MAPIKITDLDTQQQRFFETIVAIRRRRGEVVTVNELINQYCHAPTIKGQKEISNLDKLSELLSIAPMTKAESAPLLLKE